MWRLVLRVFPLALLSLVAAFMIVVYTLYYFMADEVEAALLKEAQAQIYVLQAYLQTAADPEALQQRIATYDSLHIGRFRMVDASLLSEAQRAQLGRGETVVVIDVSTSMDLRGAYYFPLASGQVMFLSDTENGENDLDELESFILFANLSVLALFLFFVSVWSAFHWAELKKLMRATDLIGRGDFSARAKLNRYASTYMVAYKVNQMAAYIERLINGQRELIHSVSHELRTPIARLNFGLALLDDVSPQQQERIKALQDDVDELSVLVNELLQLASVGQQYLSKPQPFTVRSSLLSCVPAPEIVPQHLRVSVDLPADLGCYQGDIVLLERVWKNLLGNALKYGHRQIAFSAVRLKNQGLQVCVEDDGPGVPIAEYDRIFEPFYRLDNAVAMTASGYGLGLAIVRKVVALHHGTITVSRSGLGGAKMMVSLPPLPQDGQED